MQYDLVTMNCEGPPKNSVTSNRYCVKLVIATHWATNSCPLDFLIVSQVFNSFLYTCERFWYRLISCLAPQLLILQKFPWSWGRSVSPADVRKPLLCPERVSFPANTSPPNLGQKNLLFQHRAFPPATAQGAGNATCEFLNGKELALHVQIQLYSY